MRVLHITPAFYPATYWGGPIFSVYGLCNALSRLPDVDLRILTTDSAGPKRSDRTEVKSWPVRYDDYDVFFTRRMFARDVAPSILPHMWTMIRSADVIHITGVYCFPTIPALAMARLFGKPVVWSPRGSLRRWEQSRKRTFKRLWELTCNSLLLSNRAYLHTTSQAEAQDSAPRVPRANTVVLRNGIDVPAAIPPREWMPEGRVRLMYMGRLDPIKGIENLLYALKLLGDMPVTLDIYGKGDDTYTNQLKKLVGELELGDIVAFRGQLGSDQKAAAFSCADVCVAPSYLENFCMVVAEALAHGVPVIAGRGTPWEEVERIRCGYWVANSPESLASAISGIRGDQLSEMGLRGRKWMAEAFSWNAVAIEMLDLYRRSIAGPDLRRSVTEEVLR